MEALYYERLSDLKVKCRLCPHGCVITSGRAGKCAIRKNLGGKLTATTYGRVSSVNLDPIEKKPLYHFHPGSNILSLGSLGCNLSCPFCQNYQIAHPLGHFEGKDIEEVILLVTDSISPKKAVKMAINYKASGNIGLAFTYNEPFIWFEYVLEAAKLAQEAELKTVLVTNGYVNEKPLLQLLPFIDALNIDLKGADDSVYKRLGGLSEPVKRTIKLASERAHVEITNLIVTGLNDEREQIEALVDWIFEEVGPDVPLHFSRYFPWYKYNEPPTPLETLKMAEEIGKAKLKNIHLGNVW
ncbi:MAG: AmmeMemoRadiSam system radical SAM enzyme [Actinomycetota bacterium]|nr:AmmeMemoRadiSam system radical SAM enzyme [Actinomycetota bacterium]